MKLFVDDIRREPDGWKRARTITEAIRILATQQVDEVSLDHDICCFNADLEHSSEETFEPVAWFLRFMGRDKPRIRIHTGNVVAGRRMAEIIGIADYNNDIFDHENYNQDVTQRTQDE